MKHEWLLKALMNKGATETEARTLLDLDSKFNFSAVKRKWRAEHPASEKNMIEEEKYRKKYSNTHDFVRKLKESQEPNLSLNI